MRLATGPSAVGAVSSYARLAELELEVEADELERRTQLVSSGWERPTTTVVLHGRGVAGHGEDVGYDVEDHDALAAAPPLPLAGTHTLDSFSRLLDDLPIEPVPPQRPHSSYYRRWAFESAALDLALRQAGLSLGEALGRRYEPVRFVVSTRLDPRLWLAIDPAIELKLDPTPSWTDAFMHELAATGRVRVVDFKGHHAGASVRLEPDPELYARVLAAFPEAIVEDPVVTPETEPMLAAAADRVSWDAPIHGVADLDALPFPPRRLNVKPSRFGTVRALFDFLDVAGTRGIELYGGGHFELGEGRAQIQALASLFYGSAPNDVAPPAYNEPRPRPDVPRSPLRVRPRPGLGVEAA
jgi:hypothetical protein